jgi:hypothetical protein
MLRKTKDNNIRKLVRLGGTSLAVTLPKDMLNSLGWREKQLLTVKRIQGGIVVKDYRTPARPAHSAKPKAKPKKK